MLRVGNGFDVHPFKQHDNGSDEIVICGVKIKHNYAIEATSDGDVGIHAVVDALLGAVARGDIGEHFKPNDPQWQGADSAKFLTHTLHILKEEKAKINNIDLTLICERPKLSPHKVAMQQKIAEILAINPKFVSIKATTTDKLGFLGRQEGIAAIATALVEQD